MCVGNYNFIKLKIFHLNIRSIRKNFDEFVLYLNSQQTKYEIIVLSETWINSNEETRYSLPGYNMLAQPRDGRAGGVAVYLSSTLTFTHQLIPLQTAEIIHVTLDISSGYNFNFKLSLFAIYRSCQFTFNQFKPDFENILQKSTDPTVIIGDINICTLKQNGSGMIYLNLISAYGFKNYINSPTRVVNNLESCLDHVLVRNSKNIDFKTNVEILGITDHYGVTVEVDLNLLCNIKTNCSRFYKSLDVNLLRRQLIQANWDSVYNGYDVNECVDNFYVVYNMCYESSYVLKRHNSRNKKRHPWITDMLVSLINRKNSIFKSYSKNRNNENLKAEYKELSKVVTKRIREAKINYYSSIVEHSNGDTRKYWSVVKTIMKKKKNPLSVVKINESLFKVPDNEILVANHFNDYFVNIISNLRHDTFGCNLFLDHDEFQYSIHFGNFELEIGCISNIIKSMKSKKSAGLDGINIITIKKNVDIFAPLLYNIYSKAITQGIFPDKFKQAAVVPVYKSGDSTLTSSYRPISLLNTVAKIFEIFIRDKLLSYFLERNIFSPHQYGFLPNRGTDLAIENHVCSIIDSIEKKNFTLSLYLDLQKAFDVVDVNLLVKKLRKYGIGGLALTLMESFCTGRKQCVKINNRLSDFLELRFGIPQGGVLGPLMFIVYINDLLNLRLNSSLFSYADDTALVCSASNRHALKMKINDDLKIISAWLVENKLFINNKKSKCIIFFDFGSSKEALADEFNAKCHNHLCIYECSCTRIEVTNNVQYLGLYIDEQLKWGPHVQYLTSKLRKINYALYYMRGYLKSEYLKQLYVSWVESTVRYGIIHFGGTYPTILSPLIMAQRFCLRTVFFIKKYDSLSHIFSDYNILTLEQIYLVSCSLHIYKYLKNYNLREFNRFTRGSRFVHLKLPNYGRESSRRQFCFAGKKVFNSVIIHFGNSIVNYKKPKFKMKIKNAFRNNEIQIL